MNKLILVGTVFVVTFGLSSLYFRARNKRLVECLVNCETGEKVIIPKRRCVARGKKLILCNCEECGAAFAQKCTCDKCQHGICDTCLDEERKLDLINNLTGEQV